MKKKTKIIGTISAMAVSMAMLTGGVLAASTVSLSVSSTVSFEATGVYLKAEGSVLRGSSTGSLSAYNGDEGGTYTYTGYSYTPVNAGTDDTPNGSTSQNLPAWTIGEVSFNESNTYLQYKISFTNYSEFPIEVAVTNTSGTHANVQITESKDAVSYIDPNGTQEYKLTLHLTDVSQSINSLAVNLKFDAAKGVDLSSAPNVTESYCSLNFTDLTVGTQIELSYTGTVPSGHGYDFAGDYSGTKYIDVKSKDMVVNVSDLNANFIPSARGTVEVTMCIVDVNTGRKSPSVTQTLSWDCLTGDTLLTMSNGKKKRLRSIKKGDKVLSVDPLTGNIVECEVMESDIKEVKKHNCYDKWTFSDGTVIKTVHRHRFYNIERKSYVHIDECKIGDHFLKEDGSIVELVEHKRYNRTVRHFTLTPRLYNYFANGLLSGTKQAIDVDYKSIKFN